MDYKKIFLEDDIFPLGKFETLPVTCLHSGLPNDYPDVSLLQTGIDSEKLLNEAYEHIDICGYTYVKGRLQYINPNIDEDTLRSVLGNVGFKKDTYQSFSIRKLGTSDLETWVRPYTKSFIENLPVKTFRQQYAVAYPGWNTKLHRDHNNFKIHGFRAMIPLSSNVYMGYEHSKKPIIYKLKPGNMYFVNIAKLHRGFNESITNNRINLILQMNSDLMIKDAAPVEFLTKTEIDSLPNYAKKYKVWEFGYEL